MPDPFSMVAIGAAIGGAAGKFVEKAWDSGEKWLANYFENHHQKAQEKAKENAGKFIEKIGMKVKAMEDDHTIPKEKIEHAQEQPDFSALLQKSIISAAQTESENKHDILSRIITERLQTENESLLALSSKIACDVVPSLTEKQLQILGLSSDIYVVIPLQKLDEKQYHQWLTNRLSPYKNLSFSHLDMLHIEALSCGKFQSFLGGDIKNILSSKNNNVFNYELFAESKIGKAILNIWEQNKLESFNLTTIGQLIGIMVSDRLSNSKTSFANWNV